MKAGTVIYDLFLSGQLNSNASVAAMSKPSARMSMYLKQIDRRP